MLVIYEAGRVGEDTGWIQVMTDEPSYTKLRQALRSGDQAAAQKNLDALPKAAQRCADNQVYEPVGQARVTGLNPGLERQSWPRSTTKRCGVWSGGWTRSIGARRIL